MNKITRRQTGSQKTSRNPVKIIPEQTLKKPDWIRVKLKTTGTFELVKNITKIKGLNTVCEEASCPNISECFGKGTATFMILGDLCTRRCSFCDVAHGRPLPPNKKEPSSLAEAILSLKLKYVVITSVDRDDLLDGGAEQFSNCIRAIRVQSPNTKIEILTPDFRGRLEKALSKLSKNLPDVMNHNLETVPRLYKEARPGAGYEHSLHLLQTFKMMFPAIRTKSGIMVGLGETDQEIHEVMRDLKKARVDMLTIGQYLQPTRGHLPVRRYVPPSVFKVYEQVGYDLGFSHIASGPLVRSSYHADLQAENSIPRYSK